MRYTLKASDQLNFDGTSSFEFNEALEQLGGQEITADGIHTHMDESACDYIVTVARGEKTPILLCECDNPNYDGTRIIDFWKYPDRVNGHMIWWTIKDEIKRYEESINEQEETKQTTGT